MIEVQNIQPIQKGNLLAVCDVHIKPWKLTLVDVKIFEKGANRWINLPAQELITSTGEKKYKELILFDNDTVKNKFRNEIMGAIDKYLSANPDMKQEDIIKEGDDLPF